METVIYAATFDSKVLPDRFVDDYGQSMASACVARNKRNASAARSWLESNIKPSLYAASKLPCVVSVHVAYTMQKVQVDVHIPAFVICLIAQHQGHLVMVIRVICSSIGGVGRKLMSHVEGAARALGIRHLVVDTPTSSSHGFYVKLGYRPKDASRIPYHVEHALMKQGALSPIFLYKEV